MHPILRSLHHRLVVSCQASPGDPMEDTETLRRVARSAVLAGAGGLRLNGAELVRAVRFDTSLPIIAIQKSYAGGELRITPDFASAAALAASGADIIALDCTDRQHRYGEPWREIVHRIHEELGLLVMADTATLREGILAAEGGADIVAPTLHGYTKETMATFGFHPELIAELARETSKPIVAEGNVSTPALAKAALNAGAWSVVVGSAITRPGSITATFVKAIDVLREDSHVIGIDIGGTAVKAGIVSRRGHIRSSCDVPTHSSGGGESISRSLATVLQSEIKAACEVGIKLAGVGVASAGAIDVSNGIVFAATDNLPGWADFDIRGFLRTLTPLPVFVENDAQAAALAELRFGAGRELSSFAAITVGTGIGGGFIANGQLIRGRHGFAGTVGHQTIRYDGRQCNCGRKGCLEAYVSTASLIEAYRELRPTAVSDLSFAAVAREIGKLAAAGDYDARQAYRQMVDYLAEGLANVFNLFDPEAIILSGGLIEGQTWLFEELRPKVEALLHFGSKRAPLLLHAKSGRYVGVQGAAATVFDQL